MHSILSVLIGAFFFTTTQAQSPSNDSCHTAMTIIVDSFCNFQNYDLTGSTNSNSATPTCGSYAGKEVWYSIQVPASGRLTIDTKRIATYIDFAIYTGSCGSLNQYLCNTGSSTNYLMPYAFINDTSLAGEEILLQVWGQSSTEGTFQMCVFEPASIPNPDCSSAALLTVQSNCAYSYFTTAYAGNSDYGYTTCGSYSGNDVWFKLAVPASGDLVINTVNNGIGNPAMELYTGDCGALLFYSCVTAGGLNYNQPYKLIRDTALSNDTLYVRVFKENDIHGGGFGICVYEPDPEPNGICSEAVFVPPSTTCLNGLYNSAYQVPDNSVIPPCGSYQGGMLWFKTVVPASGNLVINVSNAGIGNAAISAYLGSCDSLTYYRCDQNSSPQYAFPELVIRDSSIAADTMYFMVFKEGDHLGGAFNLCVFEPQMSLNINCSAARQLLVKPDCNFETFSNEYAASSGDGTPSCGSYLGSDVWFRFLVPDSGRFTINTKAGTMNNMAMSLYQGTCGSLSEYECATLGSDYSSNMPRIVVDDSSLAGQTMYLQLWRESSINGGTFQLCISGDLVVKVENPTNLEICAGEPIPWLSVYDGPFQYNWYDSPIGGNLIFADTHKIFVSTADSFWVEAVNPLNNQTSSRVMTSLQIHENPLVVAAFDQEYCMSDTDKLLFVTDLGATYNWFLDSEGQQLAHLNAASWQPPYNGAFYVQAMDSLTGCHSDIEELEYIVNSDPVLAGLLGWQGCDTESIPDLSVNDLGAIYAWWDVADPTVILAYDQPSFSPPYNGTFAAQAIDPISGCESPAQSVSFEVFETEKPQLGYDGTYLMSTPADHYQWYRDGLLEFGETSQSYQVDLNGIYHVVTTNADDSERGSDELIIDDIGIVEMDQYIRAYPNPSLSELNIQFGSKFFGSIVIMDLQGRTVCRVELNGNDAHVISVGELAKGPYLLQVMDHQGQIQTTVRWIKA